MLFEALTITLLSTLWSAWNANKPTIPGADDSKKNQSHLVKSRNKLPIILWMSVWWNDEMSFFYKFI